MAARPYRRVTGLTPERPDGGFVLALVVFMLFSISVAAATGYILVASEFSLSKHSSDGAEALAVARGGLERYVAESLGTLADTASYALGGGVAIVTPRKVFEQDPMTDVYYIRSEATVDDIFTPGTPARRVVGAYATYHRRPLPASAAVIVGADVLAFQAGGEAHGQDYSTSSDCSSAPVAAITGAIARVSVTEDNAVDVQGNPESRIWSGGWSQIRDSIGIRWDVLSDPNFPVEFENSLPSFASIPADSFPVIRYTGWLTASFQGRGVLIVDGVFDPQAGFQWDGIILARDVDDYLQGEMDGILIGGLEAPNMYSIVTLDIDVNYHSCFVDAANESLNYLELIPNTVYEAN
jgi:hypothetical protein